MKKLLAILFLVTLSFVAWGKTLRVGVSMGMPPMAYMEKGEIVGTEIDLLKEYAKRNDVKYKLINLKFDDLIPALNGGLIDVVMATMSHTSTRAKIVDFTEPYAIVSQMPLVHRKDAMKYQNAPMLFNTIDDVCVIKDYTAEKFVKENFHYAKVSVVADPTNAIERLLSSRSKVFVSDSILVMWLASNYKEEGLMPLPIPLRKENICWAVKKGNKDLLAKLNNFINALKAEKKLDSIIRERIPYYDSAIYKR